MTQLSSEIARFLEGGRPAASPGVRAAAGASVGAVFWVFVPVLGAIWLFSGPELVARGTVVRVDWLTLLYPLGAVCTGALFGLFNIPSRGQVARSLLGVLAFVPWSAAIAVCFDDGIAQWSLRHSLLTGLMATFLGGPLAWVAGSEQPTPGRRAPSDPPAI